MRNRDFNKYMEHIKTLDTQELDILAHAAYLLLDMTDRQISTLANYLATERHYPVVNGRLTIAQPNPHKVVVFGVCELTL